MFIENSDFMLREAGLSGGKPAQYRAALAAGDGETLTALLEDGKRRKEEIDGR